MAFGKTPESDGPPAKKTKSGPAALLEIELGSFGSKKKPPAKKPSVLEDPLKTESADLGEEPEGDEDLEAGVGELKAAFDSGDMKEAAEALRAIIDIVLDKRELKEG